MALDAMKTWQSVWLALVALSFVQGTLSKELIAPAECIRAALPGVIIIFGMAGMPFGAGLQRVHPLSAPFARFPRGIIHPFLLRQPPPLLPLGGFLLGAAGAGSALRLPMPGAVDSASVLPAPAFGAGRHACLSREVYRGKWSRPAYRGK